jgi:hypothetical protein
MIRLPKFWFVTMVDRLGDWNPQLLRELKSRLKPMSAIIAIVLSLIVQGAIVLSSTETPVAKICEVNYVAGYFNCSSESDNSVKSDTDCILMSWHFPLDVLQLGDQIIAIDGHFLPDKFIVISDRPERFTSHADYYYIAQSYPSSYESRVELMNTVKTYLENANFWTSKVTLNRPGYGEFTYSLYTGRNTSIFRLLSCIVGTIVPTAGTWMLASNLAKEDKQGNLNLIRLSPRSALTVLSGKLIGVPILLYLAVFMIIPLHTFLGLNLGLTIYQLGEGYLVFAAQLLVIYTGVILFTLISFGLIKYPELFSSLLILWSCGINIGNDDTNFLMLFLPTYSMFITWTKPFKYFNYTNFDMPLNSNLYEVLVLVNSVFWLIVLGHVIKRRFANPSITLLKRFYSYPLTIIFQLSVLWFYSQHDGDIANIVVLDVVFALILGFALSPSRQTLRDWARLRRLNSRRSLLKDLLLGDQSPPILAIALNLGILMILRLGWLKIVFPDYIAELTIFDISIMVSGILLCAAISQFLLLSSVKNPSVWNAGAILVSGVAQFRGWIFLSATPSDPFIFLALQWSLITILTGIHFYQLHKAGESELKALLNQDSPRKKLQARME